MTLPETPQSQRPRTAAVILAGGEGTRLGGAVKANILLGGRTLLERVADVLLPEAAVVVVAHGRIAPEVLQLSPALTPVADLAGGLRGPLAGLAAAIGYVEANDPETVFLVSAAVDTPFLPPDFVERLVATAQATGASAVLARCAGQSYPTNALWRLSPLRRLPARALDGTAPVSLKQLAAELGALSVDWPAAPGGDPFANVNTPADLAALEARVGRSGPNRHA